MKIDKTTTHETKDAVGVQVEPIVRFWAFIKRELIFSLCVIGSFLPMMIFMDFAFDILLYKHGVWKTIGFIFCMIFYAEVRKGIDYEIYCK